MGYQLEYKSGYGGVVYKRIAGGRKKRLLILLIPAVLLCCLFRERIINFILPGDPDATKEAISTFIGQLQEGEPVTDAFGSFCKVILNEANIS